MIIKSALLALSLILVLVIVYSFDKFRADADVYLFSFGLVAGNVLFPVWLFQGMERMKYITYINLAGRVALTVAVFVFISEQGDYMLYVILSSVTAVLVGVASLLCALKVFNIRFVLPSFDELRREAIEGWYVFISSISIVLYTSSTTFILGLFTNNTVVGYFTGADKIRQAVQGLFTPVFQTLYPYVNKLAHDSKERALEFMRKEVLYLGLVGSFICLLVFHQRGVSGRRHSRRGVFRVGRSAADTGVRPRADHSRQYPDGAMPALAGAEERLLPRVRGFERRRRPRHDLPDPWRTEPGAYRSRWYSSNRSPSP